MYILYVKVELQHALSTDPDTVGSKIIRALEINRVKKLISNTVL